MKGKKEEGRIKSKEKLNKKGRMQAREERRTNEMMDR